MDQPERSAAAPTRLKLRAAASRGLSVRAMEEADLSFVAELYASTRAEEVAATGWPEAMQRAFLHQQHEAQHRHYRAAYGDGEWLIVERGGLPIGRLYLHDDGEALRVVDISLMPEARLRGFGTLLLRDVIALARTSGRRLTLSVLRGNPARRLYDRLGFIAAGGVDSSYEEMVWRG